MKMRHLLVVMIMFLIGVSWQDHLFATEPESKWTLIHQAVETKNLAKVQATVATDAIDLNNSQNWFQFTPLDLVDYDLDSASQLGINEQDLGELRKIKKFLMAQGGRHNLEQILYPDDPDAIKEIIASRYEYQRPLVRANLNLFINSTFSHQKQL